MLALYFVVALLVISTGVFAYLYLTAHQSYSTALSSTKAKLATLQSQLDNNSALLASTAGKLLNITAMYTGAEYNLTHQYYKVLFASYRVNLPPLNVTTTYNHTTGNFTIHWVSSNYTYVFNAVYPGYLIFSVNSTGSAFDIGVTDSALKPYELHNLLYENASYTIFPEQGKAYRIPIMNGTNYFIMQNYAPSNVSVTFSLEYFGFHTS